MTGRSTGDSNVLVFSAFEEGDQEENSSMGLRFEEIALAGFDDSGESFNAYRLTVSASKEDSHKLIDLAEHIVDKIHEEQRNDTGEN